MTPSAGEQFERLVAIMRTLRSPDGCPWDRAQTLESLLPFLLEETYEAVEAIDRRDSAALKEELGDVLFEAVFLAQVSAEAGDFDIRDSLASIIDKLVRRHPHVFDRRTDTVSPAAASPRTAGEVADRWEERKASERAPSDASSSALSGIPRALPGLLRAYEIGTRAAASGFDWERAQDVVAKIDEEIAEIRDAVAGRDDDRGGRVAEELGDLLFAIANLSRKLGVEPETALRRANDKFTARFSAMEASVAARGRRLQDLSLNELEEEWQRIKAASSK